MASFKVLDELWIPENKIEIAINKTLKKMNNYLCHPMLVCLDGESLTFDRKPHLKTGNFDLTYARQIGLKEIKYETPFSKMINQFNNHKEYDSILWIEHKCKEHDILWSLGFNRHGIPTISIDDIGKHKEFINFAEHFEKDEKVKDIRTIDKAAQWLADAVDYIRKYNC